MLPSFLHLPLASSPSWWPPLTACTSFQSGWYFAFWRGRRATKSYRKKKNYVLCIRIVKDMWEYLGEIFLVFYKNICSWIIIYWLDGNIHACLSPKLQEEYMFFFLINWCKDMISLLSMELDAECRQSWSRIYLYCCINLSIYYEILACRNRSSAYQIILGNILAIKWLYKSNYSNWYILM